MKRYAEIVFPGEKFISWKSKSKVCIARKSSIRANINFQKKSNLKFQ